MVPWELILFLVFLGVSVSWKSNLLGCFRHTVLPINNAVGAFGITEIASGWRDLRGPSLATGCSILYEKTLEDR